ncbi:hypothetical protein ACFLV4_01010 [Chloroflexota bacterium]
MEGLLPVDEVERIGLQFMRDKYYRGKLTVNETRLVTEGSSPVYHLVGSIKIESRSALGRLISPDSLYAFSMQVHALEGSIVNYEVR